MSKVSKAYIFTLRNQNEQGQQSLYRRIEESK